MAELTFMTIKGEVLKLKCDLNEIMESVFKKYAEKKNENFKKLIFFSNGLMVEKKIYVKDFINNQKKKNAIILVKIMEMEVENDDSEE